MSSPSTTAAVVVVVSLCVVVVSVVSRAPRRHRASSGDSPQGGGRRRPSRRATWTAAAAASARLNQAGGDGLSESGIHGKGRATGRGAKPGLGAASRPVPGRPLRRGAPGRKLRAMKWSFHLARVAGIDVRVHATFFLLLAWFGYAYYSDGGFGVMVVGLAFILLLFVCVLLHEFGHALAARAYGIHTPDITLLPIGGVARLERYMLLLEFRQMQHQRKQNQYESEIGRARKLNVFHSI
jgi:hypothetical protein